MGTGRRLAVGAVTLVVTGGIAVLLGARAGTPPTVGDPAPAAYRAATEVPSSAASSPAGPIPSGSVPSGSVPSGSVLPWSSVDCTAIEPLVGGALPVDQAGVLVPPGATTVTRCETALGAPGRSTPAVAAPRVLTTGVRQLVDVFNALPAVPPDVACLPIVLPTQVSFVFTYPGAAPVVVVLDRTCSALVTADRARSVVLLDPDRVFDAQFDAQPAPSLTPGGTGPAGRRSAA